MPIGEIIAIGTELLLGEIVDTNTSAVARTFRELGIDLFRTMTIGDNRDRIAAAIREAMLRSDIILTTGGLGPTVDDPTREAVAQALGVELEYHPELWQQIEERFMRYSRQPTENNRRQAFIPRGAVALENPVGSAPAFYFDTGKNVIISVPGVPREMEALVKEKVVPLLRSRFKLDEIIKIHVLHCAGAGESQVDEKISEFEYLSNPTVGLLAHAGLVDIRITAKAHTKQEADQLISDVAGKIRERLGDIIFGVDGDTLDSVVVQKLKSHGWDLAVVEGGFGGQLAARFRLAGIPLENIRVLYEDDEAPDLPRIVNEHRQRMSASVATGAIYTPGADRQILTLCMITPLGESETSRSYGGPPPLGITWGIHSTLDFIRRNIP